MKRSLLASLICFGLLTTSAFVSAGDAAKGEAISTACGTCHGAEGNSASGAFPSLAGLGEKYLLKQLRDIQNGDRSAPLMAGQLDNKSDEDLQNLAAYYASKPLQLVGSKNAKVIVNSGAEVDALALGEELYRAGKMESNTPACSGCHSPTGVGNAPAGYPRLGGQHPEYIAAQLKAFRDGMRTNDGDARTMRSVAKYLNDAEIEALANYIAGLH